MTDLPPDTEHPSPPLEFASTYEIFGELRRRRETVILILGQAEAVQAEFFQSGNHHELIGLAHAFLSTLDQLNFSNRIISVLPPNPDTPWTPPVDPMTGEFHFPEDAPPASELEEDPNA